MTTRQEVYDAIDGERDYQQRRWGEHSLTEAGKEVYADEDKDVASYLTYMQAYLSQAIFIATKVRQPDPGALAAIRKVSALGVACMEQHGAPPRED